MQPFNRPENELREYQTILAELDAILATIKKDVEDTRSSLSQNEAELAELLKSQKDNVHQQELGREIEALLKQWEETKSTLEQNPDDEEIKQKLALIEERLASATDQKIVDASLTGQQIQFLRSDILIESKHLKDAEEILADWQRDKDVILKDMELMRREIEKFNQLFQSKN